MNKKYFIETSEITGIYEILNKRHINGKINYELMLTIPLSFRWIESNRYPVCTRSSKQLYNKYTLTCHWGIIKHGLKTYEPVWRKIYEILLWN